MSTPVIEHPVILKRGINHITEAAYTSAKCL